MARVPRRPVIRPRDFYGYNNERVNALILQGETTIDTLSASKSMMKPSSLCTTKRRLFS